MDSKTDADQSPPATSIPPTVASAATFGMLSILKSIAEGSAVFVAVTFVCGWSYLAAYFKTFGLNPVELNMPVPVVATLGLHSLFDAGWPLPLLVVVLIALAGVSRRNKGLVIPHNSRLALVILLAFLLGGAARIRGRQMANEDMLEDSAGLPFVAFSSTVAAAKIGPPEYPSCVGSDTFGTSDCKLLLHTNSAYYFFPPVPRRLVRNFDKLDLYVIPDSAVTGVHLQRGIDLGKWR